MARKDRENKNCKLYSISIIREWQLFIKSDISLREFVILKSI